MQCPPRQTRPAQQSPSAAQLFPASAHVHTPDVHVSRAQQSALLVQVKLRSAHAVHRSSTQREPAQQPPGPAQDSPAPPQTGAQRPESHWKPEQHSLAATQAAPIPPQPAWQVVGGNPPLTGPRQTSSAQHWPFRSQLSPRRLQRGAPQIPPSQAPEQQSTSLEQAWPSMRQPRWQRPSRQARAEQHSTSALQSANSCVQSHLPPRQEREQHCAPDEQSESGLRQPLGGPQATPANAHTTATRQRNGRNGDIRLTPPGRDRSWRTRGRSATAAAAGTARRTPDRRRPSSRPGPP